MVTLQTKFSRCKDILSSSVDNETILLSIESSRYYGMADTANRIWELLIEPISGEEIVAILQKEYDADEELCQKDVLAFLIELDSARLIQTV